MAAPPQARPDRAQRAERDAKIYRMRMAHFTERQIAAEVGLSQTRVHEILDEQIAEVLVPAAEELRDHLEAELIELKRRANALFVTATDHGAKLKAFDRLLKAHESHRKLVGADAPEALEITHAANISLSTEVTVGAVQAALAAISLPADRVEHALSAAVAYLEASGDDTPFVPPAPMSPGLAGAVYVEAGAQYIDGPGGLRYRVVATERQPGETAERPALMPARPADADVNTEELDLIEAEFADILEEADDDDPRDQEEAS